MVGAVGRGKTLPHEPYMKLTRHTALQRDPGTRSFAGALELVRQLTSSLGYSR